MTDNGHPDPDALTPTLEDIPGTEEDEAEPALTPRVARYVLADVLPALEEERAPGDAGGVPLPEAWACVQAVFGGASREDLEHAHAERLPGADLRGKEAEERLAARARDGTHLPPGLHIVTGQTGGGKSALVVNLAHAAIGAGHPVLYVSLELDAEEIAARLLALETGLPWPALALRRGLRSEAERERRRAGIAALRAERAGRFVAIVPDGALALDEIRREALALWREHGKPPLVVFDYLQAAAIQPPGAGRPLQLREHIGAVTMELRRLSRTMPDVPGWHGCPVVVLSITARSNVAGALAVPGMDGAAPDRLRCADLETLKALPKEAGEVEATAVTAWVMALGEKGDGGVRPLTLRVPKNRFGPPGAWIPFRFHVVTGQLKEAPERYAAPLDAKPAAVELDVPAILPPTTAALLESTPPRRRR